MRKFFSILGFVCAQAHIRARAKNRTKVLYFFEICNKKVNILRKLPIFLRKCTLKNFFYVR